MINTGEVCDQWKEQTEKLCNRKDVRDESGFIENEVEEDNEELGPSILKEEFDAFQYLSLGKMWKIYLQSFIEFMKGKEQLFKFVKDCYENGEFPDFIKSVI